MRKIFIGLFTLLLAVSFIGCQGPNNNTPVNNNGGDVGTGTDTGTSVTLTGITVSGTPVTSLYYVGDCFDTTTLTVTATYSDGSSKAVTNYSTAAFSEVNIGTEQAITISYTEDSVTKTTVIRGNFYVAATEAKPTESPVLLSNYSGTLSGGTYYKFGDFPQTIADSGITYTENPVYKGWYLGSNGYFYEKCSAHVYTESSNYTASNDTELTEGTDYYFKIEPIVWRVLNPSASGNKVLFAESILMANIPFYGSQSNRTLNEATINANNYKYSNIRAYLNGINNQFVTDGGTATENDIDWTGKGFIDTAFTSTAQNLIAVTEINNNQNASSNISDKIFLLSLEEAMTEDYGFSTNNSNDNRRLRKPTDYGKSNYAFQSTENGKKD